MDCRFSRIADTLLQRWSNVFLQDIGHFVSSIYSSIAKLTSASTSDFHGSISPLGGGFRNLIRSASGCLRSLLGTIAHGVGHVIPLLRQKCPSIVCRFRRLLGAFAYRMGHVVALVLQKGARAGRSLPDFLERIESHSPCLLQRKWAEAAAVRVICPFVF